MPGPPQEQAGRSVTASTWRNAALAKRQPAHAFEPAEIFPVPHPAARSPGALSRLRWAAEAAGCGTSMGARRRFVRLALLDGWISLLLVPLDPLSPDDGPRWRSVRARARTQRRRRPRRTTGRTVSALGPPTAPSAQSGPGAGGTSHGRRRHAVPAARSRPADPFRVEAYEYGRRSMRPGAGPAYLPMAQRFGWAARSGPWRPPTGPAHTPRTSETVGPGGEWGGGRCTGRRHPFGHPGREAGPHRPASLRAREIRARRIYIYIYIYPAHRQESEFVRAAPAAAGGAGPRLTDPVHPVGCPGLTRTIRVSRDSEMSTACFSKSVGPESESDDPS